MKRKTTLLLLSLMALLIPRQAMAQDVTITGYARVNINIKVTTAGSGKIYASAKEATLKSWKETQNFTNPATIGSFMGEDMICLFIYEKPEGDYSFAGWYEDDGDGVFDLEKDEFLSDEDALYYMAMLPEGTQVRSTEAAAKSDTAPSQPSNLVWAYFTRGAKAGVSSYQDCDSKLHGNCGSVWMSKPINEPGDEITIEAIPEDGFHFEYWADAFELGNAVSRENPYKFTVKGGERLYAYFVADNAPEIDLPEEGGFGILKLDKPWFLHDESAKNGAHILVMLPEDLTRDSNGRVYLDMNVVDEKGIPVAQIDVAQTEEPTVVYGKGKVRFAFYPNFGFSRSMDNLVKWSGDKGVTLKGDVIYVYIFVPELGAFIQYGTTDDLNPNATASVKVPAGVAYFQMSAFDLTDNKGNIPTAIGFTPETYDKGVAGGANALEKMLEVLSGVEGVQIAQQTLKGKKVYTLSGVEVKTTAEKGIYIVNGKKVVINK